MQRDQARESTTQQQEAGAAVRAAETSGDPVALSQARGAEADANTAAERQRYLTGLYRDRMGSPGGGKPIGKMSIYEFADHMGGRAETVALKQAAAEAALHMERERPGSSQVSNERFAKAGDNTIGVAREAEAKRRHLDGPALDGRQERDQIQDRAERAAEIAKDIRARFVTEKERGQDRSR
jgi:hypothetical protein